jgi:hypothetical protein
MVCPTGELLTGLVPVSPFQGVRYHFGMLLGVDDFETVQAYARGKMRLHNAWLHRAGVVWGFKVSFNDRKELQVDPGLALDAAGHELHLDVPVCLDLRPWFDKHEKDPGFNVTRDDAASTVTFDAHVVARFRACLTRQVPALAGPCAGEQTDTAYSRAFETVEVELRPGKAPVTTPPYHRLRLLFNLASPRPAGDPGAAADQEVLVARAAILELPGAQQSAAYLELFRKFAVLDGQEMEPATLADGSRQTWFPASDDAPVVLANVTGTVLAGAAAARTVTPGAVDPFVRLCHVATATIQELLCGPLFGGGAAAPADAGGPRIDPTSVTVAGQQITLTTTAPLHDASVTPEAFSVTVFDNAGWSTIQVQNAAFSAANNTLTLDLRAAPGASPVRLIVRGTGPTPLLGTTLIPLAGAVGGPPGTRHDGHDFVAIRS